ncbi:hypothetical protein [Halorubrum tebenquichense]|uniref:hypothetical protein n=1 Tax=Halorubrum tebenquichense TaxID=119434 RepID=UPI000677F087|nr:hypothetical protein [Halorubrum tebenquichense]
MFESYQLYREKRKLRFLIALRKTSWVFYGGFLLWMIFELNTGPIVWFLAFVAVLIAEAGLVDFDLAIEMEKEKLKQEYGEDLNWL